MKRLIYQGKIVGYEWRRKIDDASCITAWYKFEGEEDWHYNGEIMIDHDAYDTGIKHEDEWWYENDVFEAENTSNKYIFKYGESVEGHLGWYWSSTKSVLHIPLASHRIVGVKTGYMKRIGTIYDEKESTE